MESEALTDDNIALVVQMWLDPTTRIYTQNNHGNISSWDVSRVEQGFKGLFLNQTTFNDDISGWNTQSAVSFQQMFDGCKFFSKDLSKWNTSLVTDFRYMFFGAENFNSNLTLWDTSNAETMRGMFYGASTFEGVGLSYWNTSSVTSMRGMFQKATSFKENINAWKVSKTIDMYAIFSEASSFNHNISDWDVSSCTNFSYAFHHTDSFHQSLCWSISESADTFHMFDESGCKTTDSCLAEKCIYPKINEVREANMGHSSFSDIFNSSPPDDKGSNRVPPVFIAGIVGTAMVIIAAFAFVHWRRKQPRTDPGPPEWRVEQASFSSRLQMVLGQDKQKDSKENIDET